MTKVIEKEFKGVLVQQGNLTQTQFHVREGEGVYSLMLADHTVGFDGKPLFFHNAKVKITIEYEEEHKIDTSSHL